MTPPEVVVFDLGKVLLDFDYRIAARALAQNGTCDAETIVRTLLGTPCCCVTSADIDQSDSIANSVRHQPSWVRAVFANAFGRFSAIEPMIRLHQNYGARVAHLRFLNTNERVFAHTQGDPFFTGFTATSSPRARLDETRPPALRGGGAHVRPKG